MAGVSPVTVYRELTSQGASTIQALGIMANMIHESGFDPEAVGDQGTSFGVVQQHGDYGYLVTGNPAADLKKQVALLKSLGGFKAASGSTAAQAAGNFAANYERCVGCQPGGAQYNARVASAATVSGWQKSGKWPSSAGIAGGAASAAQAAAGAQQAELTAFGGDVPDWALGPTGIIQSVAESVGRMLTGTVTGAAGTAGGLEGIWKALTGIAADLNAVLKGVEWLFVPGHWVRIFCFGAGLATGLPGLHMLGKAGSGDASLATGILLVTLSGMFFFLAFHNLPADVTDLQSLLGFMSANIRKHTAGAVPPGEVLA